MSWSEGDLVSIIPSLRAYARVIARSSIYADDLVQDALERAIRHKSSFIPGSSLKAWIFRILRNKFRDDLRVSVRTVEDVNGEAAATLVSLPGQEWRLQYLDMMRAMESLPASTSEAVLLVSGAGLTHEEAAIVCGCPLGTLKSRVRRGRLSLLETIDL